MDIWYRGLDNREQIERDTKEMRRLDRKKGMD
jgi:hypothetical protein